MSDKIMYIPLDERPCNYDYPNMIYNISLDNLLRPPKSILGHKKRAANVQQLHRWIMDNIKDVSHLVLSIDMLVFGGILPSRIHHLKKDKMFSRLSLIKDIKEKNPEIKIMAFNLITRVPAYNSSDEEPDYYDNYGADIFKFGYYSDLIEQNLADQSQKEKFADVKENIPNKIMKDYLKRRNKNHSLNKKVIDYVENEYIDFLIFPMDDNSKYGFSAKERRKIIKKVKDKELLNNIYSYPGADEVGSILTIRAFLDKNNYRPKVYVKYSSERGKTITPYLEDRPLEQTVKYQILAANGLVIDSPKKSDYILFVNTPTEGTMNSIEGWESILNKEDMIDPSRNLHDFIESIKYYLKKGKTVSIADVAVLNGADDYLLQMLKNNQLLDKISAYAGWNTSSNSLGTTIAHTNILNYYQQNNGLTKEQKEYSKRFLFLRYLEDWGYQHSIRANLTANLDQYGLNYFDLKDKNKLISNKVKESLNKFKDNNLKCFNYDFSVEMPWNRMFEVKIEIDK